MLGKLVESLSKKSKEELGRHVDVSKMRLEEAFSLFSDFKRSDKREIHIGLKRFV